MKEYNIKITGLAARDMDEIYDYIANELLNPDVAAEQYNRIAEAIESLVVFPERCRILQYGVRRLIVDNYIVIYVIHDNDVIVLHVLYSASDLITRLLNI